MNEYQKEIHNINSESHEQLEKQAIDNIEKTKN